MLTVRGCTSLTPILTLMTFFSPAIAETADSATIIPSARILTNTLLRIKPPSPVEGCGRSGPPAGLTSDHPRDERDGPWDVGDQEQHGDHDRDIEDDGPGQRAHRQLGKAAANIEDGPHGRRDQT